MKIGMVRGLSQFTILAALLGAGALPWAAAHAVEYHPEALIQVGQDAARLRAHGERPVVLLDIDDTLTDSRTRTAPILRALAQDPGFQARFPQAARRMASAVPYQMHYELADSLKELGVTDPEALKEATAFWMPRFFSNACAGDQPLPGAVGYARWLVSQGATLVYLTGRDSPRMGAGTVHGLKWHGFPVGAPQTVLMMKLDKDQDDVVFKKQAFERVRALGPVVAVFENEPRNINAMHEAFPRALPIFVDSQHSNKPDMPASGVFWVRDLTRPGLARR
jgi:hypothetical protein